MERRWQEIKDNQLARAKMRDPELDDIEEELTNDLATRRFWPEKHKPRPEGAYHGDDALELDGRTIHAAVVTRCAVTPATQHLAHKIDEEEANMTRLEFSLYCANPWVFLS